MNIRNMDIKKQPPEVFYKKLFLKTPVIASFLIKLQAFSCKYWKTFKNNFFEEHLQTTSSEGQRSLPKFPSKIFLLSELTSIPLLCKSMDWFLYDNGLRHERVKSSEKHRCSDNVRGNKI